MAKKAQFRIHRLDKTVDGYRVNDYLGLYLDLELNLWFGCHLLTGQDLIGPSGKWKKKRSCLVFIESFLDMDWNVVDEKELYERNGGFEAVKDKYFESVKIAEEVE